MCLTPRKHATTVCTRLGLNDGLAIIGAKNTLCTKTGIEVLPYDLNSLHKRAFRRKAPRPAKWDWFKSMWGGANGFMAAKCLYVKHTACMNRRCAVRKTVKCLTVCKVKRWTTSGFAVHQCDSRLCLGPKNGRPQDRNKWGRIACDQTAKMI